MCCYVLQDDAWAQHGSSLSLAGRRCPAHGNPTLSLRLFSPALQNGPRMTRKFVFLQTKVAAGWQKQTVPSSGQGDAWSFAEQPPAPGKVLAHLVETAAATPLGGLHSEVLPSPMERGGWCITAVPVVSEAQARALWPQHGPREQRLCPHRPKASTQAQGPPFSEQGSQSDEDDVMVPYPAVCHMVLPSPHWDLWVSCGCGVGCVPQPLLKSPPQSLREADLSGPL